MLAVILPKTLNFVKKGPSGVSDLSPWCYNGHFPKISTFFRAHTEVSLKNVMVKIFIGLKTSQNITWKMRTRAGIHSFETLARKRKNNSKTYTVYFKGEPGIEPSEI